MYTHRIPLKVSGAALLLESDIAWKGDVAKAQEEIEHFFIALFYKSLMFTSLQYNIRSFCIMQHDYDGVC